MASQDAVSRDEAGASQLEPAGLCNRVLYRVVRLTLGTAVRLFFRMRLVNPPTLKGGYVLAANHASFLDPLLLGAGSPRRVNYLMTSVVYRSAWMGWFYRFMRAIPLSPRGGNRDALRAARAVLSREEVLGIFPEGGLSRDGEPMLGNPGAVSLGLSGGVPIVPVAIRGAYEAFPPGAMLPRPRRVELVFGDPIDPDDLAPGANRREKLELSTKAIMERIVELRGGRGNVPRSLSLSAP